MTRYYEAPSVEDMKYAIRDLDISPVEEKVIIEAFSKRIAQALHDLIKKQKCLEEMDENKAREEIIKHADGTSLYFNKDCKNECCLETRKALEIITQALCTTFGKPVGMIVPEKKEEYETCTRCGGLGRTPNHPHIIAHTCDNCNGKGKIMRKDYVIYNKFVDDFHKLNKKEG